MIMKIARLALVAGAVFVGAMGRDLFLMEKTLPFGLCVGATVAFLFMAWSAE